MSKLIDIVGTVSTRNSDIILNNSTDKKSASINVGTLNILGASSGTVTLKTAATSSDYTIKFPTGAGVTGNVLILQDGSGNLEWKSVDSGDSQSGTENITQDTLTKITNVVFPSSFSSSPFVFVTPKFTTGSQQLSGYSVGEVTINDFNIYTTFSSTGLNYDMSWIARI